MTTSNSRTAIELCCGLGGMGLGLHRLGYTIVRSYDSWDDAVNIYNANFGEVARRVDLVSQDGYSTVKSDLRQISSVDILAAGPPCKGFSRLRNGYHHNDNPHNRVIAAMPQYVALIKPRLFIIENVPDLARHDEGRTLRNLIKHLRAPGPRGLRYSVEFAIYDAAYYGTPQSRRRLIIFGVRGGVTQNRYLPEPGLDLGSLYSAIRHGNAVPDQLLSQEIVLKDANDLRLTSAAQALSDLPNLGPGQPETLRSYASEPNTAFQRYAREGAPALVSGTRTPSVTKATALRLKHVSPGGCARLIPVRHLDGLARRFDSAYRRLHPDAPSTSLSTKYDCVYHYSHARSLSVREYARLQGIPDSYQFPESIACRRYAYEMIGNAVPPLLIEGVLRKTTEPT